MKHKNGWALPLHGALVKIWPRLLLHARANGGGRDLAGVVGEMLRLRLKYPSVDANKDLGRVLKLFVPKFSWARWKQEWLAVEELRNQRATRRAAAVYPSSHRLKTARLAAAETFWARSGSPKFRKKIISGVKWGAPHLNTNGKRGWDLVIYARTLGVVTVRLANGHVGLKIVCPD